MTVGNANEQDDAAVIDRVFRALRGETIIEMLWRMLGEWRVTHRLSYPEQITITLEDLDDYDRELTACGSSGGRYSGGSSTTYTFCGIPLVIGERTRIG